MNLDQLLKEVRAQEPSTGEIAEAAARVRGRVFPQAEMRTQSFGALRSCEDFVALIPAYVAGTLDASRKLLFEVHTRECVSCRKAMARVRTGSQRVIVMPARQTVNYRGWAIAATVVLAVGVTAYVGYYEYPSLSGGPRATVEQIEGVLYRVNADALAPVNTGAQLGENDVVRTAKNSIAVLRLNDGSKVELNQRSQTFITRNRGGSVVHLALGSVIVQAAKQRLGTLQVLTADCNISVKGTVFAVDAGTKGSRVAVLEGTVWVDHGQQHDVLQKGQQSVTSADMTSVPLPDQFAWSGDSPRYLQLANALAGVTKKIGSLPAAPLRYDSPLMTYVPADAVAVAAIPNIGGTLGQARRIFEQGVAENGALHAWWSQVPAAHRETVLGTLSDLETAGKYLGTEIVVAARMGQGGSPSALVLAQTVKPGLDTYLMSLVPPASFGLMKFDGGLFAAASSAADLALVGAGGFLKTGLYQKMSRSYEQGAGWLFAGDLTHIPGALPNVAGLKDVRYVIAESKTIGTTTDNRASVTFAGNREGVASWLAAPGPMGSLDFVSPDAGLAVGMLLKQPSAIVTEMMGMMSRATGGPVVTGTAADIESNLAGAFGGDATIAFDGPLLPVPSWKIAAEMYYPGQFQSTMARLVTAFNAESGHEKTGNLKLTEADADGRAYYRLQFDKLPWEADWTFVDGYWVAAATHELVVRAIQNRQTGYTLPRSDAFRSQLAHDGYTNFSAVIYHNLGQSLAPVFGLLGGGVSPGGQKTLGGIGQALQNDKPGVIEFWAEPDRIDVASKGEVFGMNIESLLAMAGGGQAGGPARMLAGAVGMR